MVLWLSILLAVLVASFSIAARIETLQARNLLDSVRARYAAEGAVVFEGIDYFQIWVLLMLKRYNVLARHFVDLGERPRSRREIVELLRARTRPVRAVPS